jgi:uncharacterized protein (TIGR02266 family)
MASKKPTDADRPRQAHRRRVLSKPLIVLQAKPETRRATFFGYAKNISRGGMFVASVNPPRPGSRFAVEFPLPGADRNRACCQVEVVWNRTFSERGPYEPGMGMRFLDLPDDQAVAIDAWACDGD